MVGISLFQREPRIAARNPFGPGRRERNHAARVIADLPLEKSPRDDVPAEICPERRIAQYHGNTAELVAVAIDANGFHPDRLLDARRHHRRHAGSIEVIEAGAPIVIADRIHQARRRRNRQSGNGGKAQRFFRRVDEVPRRQRWPDAWRRRRILQHPVAKVHAKRVHGFRVRHRIRPEHPDADAGARTGRRCGGRRAEPAGAAAVRCARDVVSPHVRRQRYVLVAGRADEARTEVQIPDLR